MRFRPSRSFEDRILTELPGVNRLEHEGARIVVTGSGDLLNIVVRALSSEGVEALEVQLEERRGSKAPFLRLIGPSERRPKEEVTSS